MSEILVELTGGTLSGARDDGVASFKGIPYAEAPTGARRFRAPAPPAPWSGTRDATALPPSCPQPHRRPGGWSYEATEDEDCLALNVWTPAGALDGSPARGASSDDKRPVMVWFHGGGFNIGSGSWPLYDGAALARRGDVVVVTVNHRLGPLGFLHLGEILGEDYAQSGNVGMLDLVASLEWVRDNIGAFGGDADNVTIFGESGGGMKVSLLMVMPAARGLFHKAVVQSGPGLRIQSRRRATELARGMLAELDIAPDRAADLLDQPAEALVKAQNGAATHAGMGGRMTFGPFVDGTDLPMWLSDALVDGTAADVPLMIGTTRDEATLTLAGDPVLTDPSLLDEAELARRVSVFTKTPGAEHAILDAYRAAEPEASDLDLLIAAQSDAFMRIPSIRMAERKLKGGAAPVFSYLFTWEAGPLRASHGFELPFVFDNVHEPVLHPSASRQELADAMSEAWLAFARTGDPGHDGLDDWPPYDTADRATMVFDRGECHLELDPLQARREAWDGVEIRGVPL